MPGVAMAIVLCWVHVFVLPPLFCRSWRLCALVVGAVAGAVASPLAVLIGFLSGFIPGTAAFTLFLAVARGADGGVPASHATNIVVEVLLKTAELGLMLFGSAVAALAAVGMALLSRLTRPRLSWRVPLAGACSAVVVRTEWLPLAFNQSGQAYATLLVAALPSLVLIRPDSMITELGSSAGT